MAENRRLMTHSSESSMSRHGSNELVNEIEEFQCPVDDPCRSIDTSTWVTSVAGEPQYSFRMQQVSPTLVDIGTTAPRTAESFVPSDRPESSRMTTTHVDAQQNVDFSQHPSSSSPRRPVQESTSDATIIHGLRNFSLSGSHAQRSDHTTRGQLSNENLLASTFRDHGYVPNNGAPAVFEERTSREVRISVPPGGSVMRTPSASKIFNSVIPQYRAIGSDIMTQVHNGRIKVPDLFKRIVVNSEAIPHDVANQVELDRNLEFWVARIRMIKPFDSIQEMLAPFYKHRSDEYNRIATLNVSPRTRQLLLTALQIGWLEILHSTLSLQKDKPNLGPSSINPELPRLPPRDLPIIPAYQEEWKVVSDLPSLRNVISYAFGKTDDIIEAQVWVVGRCSSFSTTEGLLEEAEKFIKHFSILHGQLLTYLFRPTKQGLTCYCSTTIHSDSYPMHPCAFAAWFSRIYSLPYVPGFSVPRGK